MKRGKEVIRFVITGGVCFLIELGFLILLRDKIGLPTLAAVPIAFLISVVVNYVLCVRWVFPGTGNQKALAKAGFLVTSAMGLLLNELFMWLFGLLWGEDGVLLTVFSFTVTMYMFSKCLSTLLVMIWNYFTKRWILRKGQAKKPADPIDPPVQG